MKTDTVQSKSTPRLIGVRGTYLPDPEAPDEASYGWTGEMRVVHSQRARKLRRRGEQVIDTGERTANGRHVLAWFVEPRS